MKKPECKIQGQEILVLTVVVESRSPKLRVQRKKRMKVVF